MLNIYYLETVYQPSEWMTIFLELGLYLKEKYGATIIHQKGGYLHMERFNYDLPDCVLFVHDDETDKLIGLSFEDNPGRSVDVFVGRNKPGDILVLGQFHNRFPKDFDRSIYNFKIKEGTWYPGIAHTNYEYYYLQRKLYVANYYETLIDEMFFLGGLRGDIPELRNQGLCCQKPGNLHHIDYMNMAIKYKVGFAIGCVGEICYRDFEYLAVGLPMLRIQYMSQVNPPLIPNYHYIAVDRTQFPWDMNRDREGGPLYVEAYKERFLKVKDDKDFLLFIAKNGREYYETYCHPSTRLNHLLNIIELK
jgi:hypothetical protein